MNGMRAELLPESLHEIADLIGLPATLKLVERWGGLIKLYIPLEITPEHPLAVTLGWEAAQALVVTYGGDEIRNIPRCAAGIRTLRNVAIRTEHDAGVSAVRLALKHGLTERQIWTILGEETDDDRQSALF